ncbi:MAG TPA: PIG-L family deacetylase [Chitinophagaceae bacterium]|nr:PIG-L family deacetylase [Chitinophagaceae bacterium]HNO01058.1 PIG-L family deacetylase [Chitinophagaceae bacterium]
MFNPKKILILAPHTDDGELGCGGSIAKFCAEGKEVYYVAFCLCSASLPTHLPSDTLEQECKKATASLGIPASNLILFNYEVRQLPAVRQQILEELLQLNKKINPDLVFLPAVSDVHQDHHVIHQEGLRAFKNTTLAGYELPWNNYSFHTHFFIPLSADHLNKKLESLKAYQSQSHRNYMNENFTRSLATVRGVQCNSAYAEAFEIYRLMGS